MTQISPCKYQDKCYGYRLGLANCMNLDGGSCNMARFYATPEGQLARVHIKARDKEEAKALEDIDYGDSGLSRFELTGRDGVNK